MKKIFFLLCCLFLNINFGTAKTKIFITTSALGDNNGKEAEGYLTYFSNLMANAFEKEYPCCQVSTISDVRTLIGWERWRQLLTDVKDDSQVRQIGEMMGCEYLVSLKENVLNGVAYLEAFCMKYSKTTVLARAFESATHGGPALDACKRMADKLIKDLSEYEICPYKGKVTIEVKSQKEESTSYSSPAPCTGNVNTTINQISNSTLKWDLNKAGLNKTNGTSNYNLYEKITTIIVHPCYKCKNGMQGGAEITDSNESEATVQGLSDESMFEGARVNDARIKLQFLEDGTFYVHVKATSEKGRMKVTTEKKIEGPCQDESEPPDTDEKRIDVPINAVFGPFKGTAQDKVLNGQKEEDLSRGKEKASVRIEFNLTMEI